MPEPVGMGFCNVFCAFKADLLRLRTHSVTEAFIFGRRTEPVAISLKN